MVPSHLLLRQDHPVSAKFRQNSMMRPVRSLHPDCPNTKHLEIHRRQDTGLNIPTDRDEGDIVLVNTHLFQRHFVGCVEDNRRIER